MIAKIIRVGTDEEGTFGVLTLNGKAFCVTLEPQDLDNEDFISCIPVGLYLCKKIVSPRYGEVFEVQDVPERENILFHAGNRDINTQGCILLGQYFGKLKGDRAVLNSGNTLKLFHAALKDQMSFALHIMEI